MSEPAGSSDPAASDELSQQQEAMRTLLSRLHKQLVRRDVNDIFAKPVTDDIAPRYSEIITSPMDLSTMRGKIDANQYANVADFRGDFRLMCQNAMTYNTPDTIFYAEADKLMTEGDRLMAFDKLSQLRKQCGLAHRLADEDLQQAVGGRSRRHPQQQQLAKASPKSSPRSASLVSVGSSGNRRRPASAATPPPSAAASSAASSSSAAAAAAADIAAATASRPASASVPDDIFDSVVLGGGDASNSGASHSSSGGNSLLESAGGGGGDVDGEGSGNSSSNMVVLIDEEGSDAGQMEIEELVADEDEDDDRSASTASYTDPTPVGELTSLAEAAAAEARARLLSAGPPLVGRIEEPGLVFVPVDDYEDYFSSAEGSAAAAAADVKRLCRRQVLYPADASRLLGLQDSEQATLDQLTSRLLPTAGGPLLAVPAGTGDRVDAFLAQEGTSADLLGEVYGDRLALEYVLSVQTYIAGCSRSQRRLVNKYFNLVTEGDHKRCEPLWRQFQRRQRVRLRRRQRRLQGDVKGEADDMEDESEDDGEEDDDGDVIGDVDRENGDAKQEADSEGESNKAMPNAKEWTEDAAPSTKLEKDDAVSANPPIDDTER